MNTLKFQYIFTLLVLVLSLVGCADDDEETNPESYGGWGFIYILDSEYYINSDWGSTLKINDLSDEYISLVQDNDRIIFNFHVIETPDAETLYDYKIEIEALKVVDYDFLVTVNDESRDTLGNGTLGIGTNSHLYGNNLNLELFYLPQKDNHIFTLCYDETMQTEGEPVILDLRNYYTEEGTSDTYVYTYKTFDISEILSFGELNEDEVIPFVLRINYNETQEQGYTFEYDPN